MALFLFTKAILNAEPIKVFNYGKMERDFTYIDDIIEGLVRVIKKPPKVSEAYEKPDTDPARSQGPYKIYNIGNNKPVQLMEFIETIERHLGKKAKKDYLPMQPGDVPKTYADIDDLVKNVGFKPETSIDEGIGKFVEWYGGYYVD